MIQLNLLPDIKEAYIKAQRTKRSVMVISIITMAVALGAVGLLAGVAYGAQAVQLSTVQEEIDEKVVTLNGTQDLDKILTIQNQLTALTSLHESKPVVMRVFTYIQQTLPQDVRLDTYSINYADGTISVEGNAPNLEIVNKYVDTIKFTEIEQTDPEASKVYAFREVVLTNFSTTELETNFSVTYKFDESLFNVNNPDIKLVIPAITTTRSQTEQPGALFVPNAEETQ